MQTEPILNLPLTFLSVNKQYTCTVHSFHSHTYCNQQKSHLPISADRIISVEMDAFL